MKCYIDWIESNVTDPHLKCAEYTLAMQEEFPELKRVRGYYHDVFDGKRTHWWLVTSEGSIIDPTVAQFNPCGSYEPYDESLGEPKGKCMECGDISYLHANACSESCIKKLEVYYNA